MNPRQRAVAVRSHIAGLAHLLQGDWIEGKGRGHIRSALRELNSLLPIAAAQDVSHPLDRESRAAIKEKLARRAA